MFKVLIIDDLKSIHSFVKNLLSKAEGVTVTSAFNGQEALDLLSREKNFDVIFLDWEMPVLTGPETMKGYAAMGLKVPVIMMTTKNSAEDIQTMLNLGVSEYLLKPFTADILFQKITFVTGQELPYAA